jgi:ABC-type uncharacterized transport system permease subunit
VTHLRFLFPTSSKVPTRIGTLPTLKVWQTLFCWATVRLPSRQAASKWWSFMRLAMALTLSALALWISRVSMGSARMSFIAASSLLLPAVSMKMFSTGQLSCRHEDMGTV